MPSLGYALVWFYLLSHVKCETKCFLLENIFIMMSFWLFSSAEQFRMFFIAFWYWIEWPYGMVYFCIIGVTLNCVELYVIYGTINDRQRKWQYQRDQSYQTDENGGGLPVKTSNIEAAHLRNYCYALEKIKKQM